MAHFICPTCGSKYFSIATTGQKLVFQVLQGRTVEFVEPEEDCVRILDREVIQCGGCSWKGHLAETVECHLD